VNGTVAKVEFFNGALKLGEDTSSPYSFALSNNTVGTFAITAKATDNGGAFAISAAITINVTAAGGTTDPTNPVVSIVELGSDVELTLPQNSVILQPQSVLAQNTLYAWTQVDGPSTALISNPGASEVNISNLVAGTYIFQLVVTDASGATSSDEIKIIVHAGSEVLAGEIPKFFSPNNDGTGDTWVWPNLEIYANARLTVFNRAGQRVYEAAPYQNNWDGKSNGQALQDGDYYYIIQLEEASLRGAVRITR
jgi:gliding motility-associated-like protein